MGRFKTKLFGRKALPKTRQEKFGELVKLMVADPNQYYRGFDLAKEADQDTINACLKQLLATGHLTLAFMSWRLIAKALPL